MRRYNRRVCILFFFPTCMLHYQLGEMRNMIFSQHPKVLYSQNTNGSRVIILITWDKRKLMCLIAYVSWSLSDDTSAWCNSSSSSRNDGESRTKQPKWSEPIPTKRSQTLSEGCSCCWHLCKCKYTQVLWFLPHRLGSIPMSSSLWKDLVSSPFKYPEAEHVRNNVSCVSIDRNPSFWSPLFLVNWEFLPGLYQSVASWSRSVKCFHSRISYLVFIVNLTKPRGIWEKNLY